MFEYDNNTLSIRSKRRTIADYLVSVDGLFVNAPRKSFSYLEHIWLCMNIENYRK